MAKATDEELTAAYRLELASDGGPLAGSFVVRSVQQVNHKPHPFMVGARHVEVASRSFGGRLGKEVCDQVGCDWREGANPGGGRGPRCGRPTAEHTSDRVLFLSMVRHLTRDEATAALGRIADRLKADGVDGVAFVETPERFRVEGAK
jgi:hypothetical protein